MKMIKYIIPVFVAFLLTSCSDDKTIKIWEVGNEKCIQSIEMSLEGVKSIMWNKKGNSLISLSQEGIVKIWSIE